MNADSQAPNEAEPIPQRFGRDIWTVDGARVRMFGIPFSTRMTIIRLQSGGLWLHSPITAPDAIFMALGRLIDSLGTVEYLVAPNKIHSLGIPAWRARYPEACIWVSPGFKARHGDIPFDDVLGEHPRPEWAEEIDFHPFAGSRWLDEVVFLHRASKTLIVTDLIQKHEPESETGFWRWVKKQVGVLGADGGTARDLRATFNDRAAAKSSREFILRWDFDRLILCHGLCTKCNARSVVADALAWLGPTVLRNHHPKHDPEPDSSDVEGQ